jgi:hypothetical protein
MESSFHRNVCRKLNKIILDTFAKVWYDVLKLINTFKGVVMAKQEQLFEVKIYSFTDEKGKVWFSVLDREPSGWENPLSARGKTIKFRRFEKIMEWVKLNRKGYSVSLSFDIYKGVLVPYMHPSEK